jgi:uncharacterized protein YggU (UPF0235/DUF167 family)
MADTPRARTAKTRVDVNFIVGEKTSFKNLRIDTVEEEEEWEGRIEK